MTRIEFHFNTPERLQHTCRLLRKAYLKGARLQVLADPSLSVGETSLVTITFSEAVTGFSNDDLSVANGTLSAVMAPGVNDTETFTYTASNGTGTSTTTVSSASSPAATRGAATGSIRS